MISPDKRYHTGPRALIYMILRKMKYPLVLIVTMFALTVLLHLGHSTLALWQAGASPLAREGAVILYAIQKYGWIFTVLLGVFLGSTVVPEYRGLTIAVGAKALYVRSGVLTYREIAIPYRQIQTINIIEEAGPRLFGLCSLVIVTSARDNAQTNSDESEALIELIHKSLARDLQQEILQRLGTPTA